MKKKYLELEPVKQGPAPQHCGDTYEFVNSNAAPQLQPVSQDGVWLVAVFTRSVPAYFVIIFSGSRAKICRRLSDPARLHSKKGEEKLKNT